jgi:hypothetical protein
MIAHNYNLKDKVITSDDYKFNRNPPIQYGLHDKMVCYFDGYHRKVVPLDTALSSPIIYDKYVGKDDKLHDITVAVCPFTLASAVLDGKFTATQYVENSCLVITNGESTFPLLNAFIESHKSKEIKKFEVDIKVLRNVFTEYPDCKYMDLITNKGAKHILPTEYYSNQETMFKHLEPANQFHNKTLVYLIQYISSKDHLVKSTILVGRDANPNDATGYNVVVSGIYEYILQYDDKIKQKFGFVMPVMWFAWKSFFPDSKIVYIS